jgi:phosphoribosyl 1,2-cyclic phosphodiesterase
VCGKVPVPGEQFSVHFLSSGSSGNCTLVRDGDDLFLIDFGLPPEKFLSLLRPRGVCVDYWREARVKKTAVPRPVPPNPPEGSPRLRGALLTHLHGDHFSAQTLRLLADNAVQVWVHRDHLPELEVNRHFRRMREAGLVNVFNAAEFSVTPSCRVTPLTVPHDSVSTHGFLIQRAAPGGRRVRMAYLADLGHFPQALVRSLADCDLVALEFNHDVELERRSMRHPNHIGRVLGSHGHLSNEQAADALRAILAHSHRTKPRFIALLHLSSDCNRPELALVAARGVLEDCGVEAEVLVTRQREYAGFVDLLAPEPGVTGQKPGRVAHNRIEPGRRPVMIIQDLFEQE